jgi:hypothetical protein
MSDDQSPITSTPPFDFRNLVGPFASSPPLDFKNLVGGMRCADISLAMSGLPQGIITRAARYQEYQVQLQQQAAEFGFSAGYADRVFQYYFAQTIDAGRAFEYAHDHLAGQFDAYGPGGGEGLGIEETKAMAACARAGLLSPAWRQQKPRSWLLRARQQVWRRRSAAVSSSMANMIRAVNKAAAPGRRSPRWRSRR